MSNALYNVMQRLNGYAYSKKVRRVVFWALLVCTLAVFAPLVLSESYRVCVIHAMEKLVMHRTLRRYDKWHSVLCAFGVQGIVFGALICVLCRKNYVSLKALRARLVNAAFMEKVLYAFVMANFAVIATALVNQSIWCDEGLALIHRYSYIAAPVPTATAYPSC